MFRPPPALECKSKDFTMSFFIKQDFTLVFYLTTYYCCICLLNYNCLLGCRVKIHKEHYGEEALAPCKVHYDPNTAKELLLLATSEDDQKLWVSRLSKRIQKGGYKAVSQSRY